MSVATTPDRRRLLLAALAGAGTMILELSAPRLFQPWFGASTYVWTNVIGVILFSLAMGYRLGGSLADRPDPDRRLGLCLLFAAVWSILIPFGVAPMARFFLPEPSSLIASSEGPASSLWASLLGSIVLFAPPVFFLGMVSPHVVRILSDRGTPTGLASGSVFMAGTLGSLIGTFLPAYVLIPHLGTRWTFGVAAGFFVLAFVLSRPFSRSTLQPLAGLLLLMVLSASVWRTMPLREAWNEETLLDEIESEYQYLRLAEAPAQGPGLDGRREKVLRINEGILEYHSVLLNGNRGTGGKYYDTLAALIAAHPLKQPLNVMVLGSGAGTLAKTLIDLYSDRIAKVINIDVDPAVVGLESEFGLGAEYRSRVASYAADARQALTATSDQFDAIVLDAYARQIDIPFHLATREFFTLVKTKLAADGLLLSNISAVDLNDPILNGILLSHRAAGFESLNWTPVSGFPNGVLWTTTGRPVDLSTQGLSNVAAEELRRIKSWTESIAPRTKAPQFTDNFAPLEFLAGRFRP